MSLKIPFKGSFKVTSPQGYRTLNAQKEYHKGIDLVGIDDATIYAISDGVVYTLCEPNGFGQYIRQLCPDGNRLYYAHLKSFCVKNGQAVKKGDAIGIMGFSGKATGPHLHLELRLGLYGYESTDISEFTGIPNKKGIYSPDSFSNDKTVNDLLRLDIIDSQNRTNWELMLSGQAPLNPSYVRTIFDRLSSRLSLFQSGVAK